MARLCEEGDEHASGGHHRHDVFIIVKPSEPISVPSRPPASASQDGRWQRVE